MMTRRRIPKKAPAPCRTWIWRSERSEAKRVPVYNQQKSRCGRTPKGIRPHRLTLERAAQLTWNALHLVVRQTQTPAEFISIRHSASNSMIRSGAGKARRVDRFFFSSSITLNFFPLGALRFATSAASFRQCQNFRARRAPSAAADDGRHRPRPVEDSMGHVLQCLCCRPASFASTFA
jgi:hypothetical protein